MFGFGKKRKLKEAKKFAEELGQAAAADIDAFIRDHVAPAREAYLSIMIGNLEFDPSGEASPTESGYENFGAMMQEWAGGAYQSFQQAGEPLWRPFEENEMEDIAAAIKQRFEGELNEQSYKLACDGIEAVREAIAAHRGDPPLNGEGMDSVREIVKLVGDPNAHIDWDAVFAPR